MSILKRTSVGLMLFTTVFFVPSNAAERGTTALPKQEKGKHPIEDLVQYAKPISGTGKDGNTYPGATTPFGMIQWSPDADGGQVRGGYNYQDSTIFGFSLDHLSGAGCYYAGNFGFMPMPSGTEMSAPHSRTDYSVSFSHNNEVARPGYYSVTLDNGLKIELTTTTRSGFGRFTYPGGGPGIMRINASSNTRGTILSLVHVDPETHSISGAAVGGNFCGQEDINTIYFYAVFDRPFVAYSVWSNDTLLKGTLNAQGVTSGAFVIFDLPAGRVVLAKVGMSYVSIANAKENLDSESPTSAFSSKDFDAAVATTSDAWNARLNRIQVKGGTNEERETFYSMVYHTLLGPTVCSDVNGEYMGYDGQVHTTADGRVQYANFSGWDIYRSECQFLAMIAPKEASDMAQSLLVDYQQGGAFPRWGVPNEDSGVMMGDPAAPIIAGFYAFGARNFDTHDALAGLVRAATDPSVRARRSHTIERDALADYLKLGYVPEHQKGSYGNVSMTLEFVSADFALSQFGEMLGDTANSALLLKQAQNWKNLYNRETGYIQMKRRDGMWAPGFAINVSSYDGDQAYVEGTAGQYVWMVPFNLEGLASMMGGPEIAATRLDTFFTNLNGGSRSEYAYLGNEPCAETPWIYDFLGQPYKTQEIVRNAMVELFSPGPIAFPGNDDLGQMSSWYVFGALGMYPELPGSDVLVLGSPMFPEAVLHLTDGDVTIKGKGARADAPYVRNLTVNGKQWSKPWIRFADIASGGTMEYKLSSTPDKRWGSAPEDAPPSYDGSK